MTDIRIYVVCKAKNKINLVFLIDRNNLSKNLILIKFEIIIFDKKLKET